MGVQGLWELVAPVGRRVSVETLAGKKVAIDASIWMVQFMKAMRDPESGDMIRNAHILGFFRRICKLLFLRTKPVFVFDGATPSLKRRTVAARRRQRDNARSNIRKTAEKLLLNNLKAKRLEELAQEINKTTKKKKNNNSTSATANKGKDDKGKQVVPDDDNQTDKKTHRALAQEALDEMLAASLAAEEEEELNGSKAASAAGDVRHGEDDHEDEDEEMILPVTSNNIDPAVLASLPPSMQLDLLVQMRERSMAENRQKYQKIKKTPTKFSELQIQSYLKTVAFRREIDQVQRCASGRGLEGVQSSRIASEANREFIFSSSFTGDKQSLSTKTVEKYGDTVKQSKAKTITLDSVKRNLFTSQSQSPAESTVDKVVNDFGNDVETYTDENGRVRVSRVRGLGLRMTRDLQRNLDLMKEYEEDYSRGDTPSDLQPNCTIDVPCAQGNNSSHNASISNEGNSNDASGKTPTLTQEDHHSSDDLSVHGIKDTIEISFIEDDHEMKDTDDDLFLRLISGTPTSTFSSASIHSGESKDESESECIWEEGAIGEQNESWQNDRHKEGKSSLAEDNICEDNEVEWEEGNCDSPKKVSDYQEAEHETPVSREVLEEEADIQEAIQRSLQDIQIPKALTKSSSKANLETYIEDNPVASPQNFTFDENVQQNVTNSFDGKTVVAKDSIKMLMVSSDFDGSRVEIPHTAIGEIEHHVNYKEQCMDTPEQSGVSSPSLRISTADVTDNRSNVDFKTVDNALEDFPANIHGEHSQTSESNFSTGRKDEPKERSLEEKAVVGDTVQDIGIPSAEGLHLRGENVRDDHNVVSEANLDEEISLLRQQCITLGDEQRKLERNAESVSSEMFAECQELLQMFGLPYIIAPMEAEAQCAYMEMLNLVDGVVTDDSDVFLFGARNVYRNIFDDRKYVETYLMKDIESELGLKRETLIRMALLLGSDYTEGVSGIGIVNAIEVVRAFPEEDGLQKFREWIESPDPSILGKLNSHNSSNSKKQSLKSTNKDGDGMSDNVKEVPSVESGLREHEDQPSVDDILQTKEIFMTKHRNVSKNWHLPSSFPSESVITAYTSPQVDNSTEPFIWGKPDLFLLRKLCWERFGWDNKKADELLLPVLKEYNKHETQLRLEAFYTFNERFAKIRSKRIKKAVKGITGKCSTELMDDDLVPVSSSGKKSACDPSAVEIHKTENCSVVKDKSTTKKASKKPTGGKTDSQDMQSEKCTPQDGRRIDKSGLTVNRRGRGRERGKGKGTEEELNTDSSEEANSSDGCGEMEKHIQAPDTMSELRRSKRRRKHVKYDEGEENVEVDLGGSSNDAATFGQEAVEAGDVYSLSRDDYLASGGGFCMDESESGEKGSAAAGDSNHLFSGGGFCIDDESETHRAGTPNHIDVVSAKGDRESDQNSPAMKHVDSSYKEEEAQDVGDMDLGLKAMPFLRKKKRRKA